MKLTGEKNCSRKNILNKMLDQWRLADSQSRSFLANDPGLLIKGDMYCLDTHAIKDAQTFITEILDENSKGSWKPRTSSTKKKSGDGI